MENISVKLNLLLFCLHKKTEKLEEIKACTLEQGNVEKQTIHSRSELFARKQNLIIEIEKLDQGFDGVSAEIMPVLQKNAVFYADSIHSMQKEIQRITELSAEIKLLEKKNYVAKMLLPAKEETMSETIRLPKQKALGNYQKMKK